MIYINVICSAYLNKSKKKGIIHMMLKRITSWRQINGQWRKLCYVILSYFQNVCVHVCQCMTFSLLMWMLRISLSLSNCEMLQLVTISLMLIITLHALSETEILILTLAVHNKYNLNISSRTDVWIFSRR